MTPFPCIVFPHFKRVGISAVSFQQFRFGVGGFEGHRNETLESHVAQSWWRRQWYFSTDLLEKRKWLCFLPLPYCYSILALFPLKASVCSPFFLPPPPPPPMQAIRASAWSDLARSMWLQFNSTWQLYSLSNSGTIFPNRCIYKSNKECMCEGLWFQENAFARVAVRGLEQGRTKEASGNLSGRFGWERCSCQRHFARAVEYMCNIWWTRKCIGMRNVCRL